MAGARSRGETSVPFSDRYSVELSLQSPINRALSIGLSVTHSAVARNIYGSSIVPSLALYARF